MRFHFKLSIFFICFLTILPSNSKADGPAAIMYEAVVPETYRNESNFTQVPALIGGLVLSVPAFVVGGIVYTFGYGVGLPLGMEDEFALYSGGVLGFGMVRLGSTVTGAPFYALEKTFHDAPKALFYNDQTDQPGPEHMNNFNKLKDTHEMSQEVTPRKIVKVKVVESPTRKCTPREVAIQEIGKSLRAGEIPGGSMIMTHGYSSLCDKENK